MTKVVLVVFVLVALGVFVFALRSGLFTVRWRSKKTWFTLLGILAVVAFGFTVHHFFFANNNDQTQESGGKQTQRASAPAKSQAPAGYYKTFCWSKPADVVGTNPAMRTQCVPIHIRQWNPATYEFVADFTTNDGSVEHATFYMDRYKGNHGSWTNGPKLAGNGVWEVMPAVDIPVRMFGRMKDSTADDKWVNFWIR